MPRANDTSPKRDPQWHGLVLMLASFAGGLLVRELMLRGETTRALIIGALVLVLMFAWWRNYAAD